MIFGQHLLVPPPTATGVTYATWNSADKGSGLVLSNGDLTVAHTAPTWRSIRATQGKASGKWYFETTIGNENTALAHFTGAANSSAVLTNRFGIDANGWAIRDWSGADGQSYTNNVPTTISGMGHNAADIVMIALDMDTGEIWFGVNGTWDGDPSAGTGARYSGLSGTIYPGLSLNSNTEQSTTNFGATAFSHTVPSGFNSGVYV